MGSRTHSTDVNSSLGGEVKGCTGSTLVSETEGVNLTTTEDTGNLGSLSQFFSGTELTNNVRDNQGLGVGTSFDNTVGTGQFTGDNFTDSPGSRTVGYTNHREFGEELRGHDAHLVGGLETITSITLVYLTLRQDVTRTEDTSRGRENLLGNQDVCQTDYRTTSNGVRGGDNGSVTFLIDFSITGSLDTDVTVTDDVVGVPGLVTDVQGTTRTINTLTNETVDEVTIHGDVIESNGVTVTNNVLEVRETVEVRDVKVVTFTDGGQVVLTVSQTTSLRVVLVSGGGVVDFVTLDVSLTFGNLNSETFFGLFLGVDRGIATVGDQVTVQVFVEVEYTINDLVVVVLHGLDVESVDDVVTGLIEGTTGKDVIQPVPLNDVTTLSQNLTLLNGGETNEVGLLGTRGQFGEAEGNLQTVGTRGSEVGGTLGVVEKGGVVVGGNDFFVYQETNGVVWSDTVLVESDGLGFVSYNVTIDEVGTFGYGEQGTVTQSVGRNGERYTVQTNNSSNVVRVIGLKNLTFSKGGLNSTSTTGVVDDVQGSVFGIRSSLGVNNLTSYTRRNTDDVVTNKVTQVGTTRKGGQTSVGNPRTIVELTRNNVITFIQQTRCKHLNLVLHDSLGLRQFPSLDRVARLIQNLVKVLVTIEIVEVRGDV